MFNFNSLKQSVDALVQQVRDIRKQIADLQNRREKVEKAPPSRGDFKVAFDKFLDGQEAKWLQSLASSFEFFHRHPGRLVDGDALNSHMTLFGVARHTKDVDQTRGFDGLFAALVPTMREELHARIDALPWPADSLPLAGRDKAIEDIDQQLEDLMTKEAELVTAAARAGVVIEGRVK